AFALAVAVVAVPVALAAMLVVRLTSRGPAIYTQKRVGYAGRPFTIYKIRTMIHNCESLTGPRWCVPGDPRVTPVGVVLRKLHIDELPQLLNVLRGEMSLVGPRPERPEFIAQFRKDVPGYMQKHLVKAGITGWAQVNDLRGSSDLPKRIQYDLYYIDNWSLWFDLRILGLTIMHIFRSRNAY